VGLHNEFVNRLGSLEGARDVRVVHFTDTHIQPERGAFEGVQSALRAVVELDPPVDALLLGGDVVMNTVGVGLDRASAQWDLWDRAIAEHPDLVVLPCIGNQDCWGWNLKQSRCTGAEPLFGKAMAMKRLSMKSRFYRVRVGAWRVLVLDSLQQGGNHGYTARLDDKQREWLKAELCSDEATPTLIMTHVPIVAGPADFFSSKIEAPGERGDWVYPGQHIHADSFEIVELLRLHPNVKVCVAGHIHCTQRIDYRGICFLHSPAVCGEWWRGAYQGFAPGFTVIDLRVDGSFGVDVVSY